MAAFSKLSPNSKQTLWRLSANNLQTLWEPLQPADLQIPHEDFGNRCKRHGATTQTLWTSQLPNPNHGSVLQTLALHTSSLVTAGSIDDSKYAIFRMSPLPMPPPLLQRTNEQIEVFQKVSEMCETKITRLYYTTA